jgi:hypothetical protein
LVARPKPGTHRYNEMQGGPGRPASAGAAFDAAPRQPRPKRSPDQAPDGYAQDYWDLARYFIERAHAAGEHTRSVPVAYLAIKERAEQQNLETGEDALEFDRSRPVPEAYYRVEEVTVETRFGPKTRTRRTRGPLPADFYVSVRMRDLYLDGKGRPVDWQHVGLAIIDKFWDDPKVQEARQGPDPLSDFTRDDLFEHCYVLVVRHWESLRIKAAIARQQARRQSRPDYQPRDIIRRKPLDQ